MDDLRVPLPEGSTPQSPAGVDKEFMATLAKGLAVIQAFGAERPSLTLSQAAAAVGLSRATARRVLRTLAELGYVEQDGRNFALAPRVLELGFSYLSGQNWIDRAQPLMKALSEELQESCSASVLQGGEIIYVARVQTRRIMASSIAVGARLTAFHTSMGRIQLGYLADDELWRRLRAARIEPMTPSTITDLRALFERIKEDHARGFSIVDEELEKGLRSISVALTSRRGRPIGAVNVSAHSNRTTRNEMRERFLPRLREIAQQVAVLTE
ncbi:MAG TPA: IclR family transcriptional regulator C-terminal domain-containing protein [Roseiarcus sp.]|nr:IclR family transcriptional regulator C-terminal domain-containing protein [Roseiarcus sp.]